VFLALIWNFTRRGTFCRRASRPAVARDRTAEALATRARQGFLVSAPLQFRFNLGRERSIGEVRSTSREANSLHYRSAGLRARREPLNGKFKATYYKPTGRPNLIIQPSSRALATATRRASVTSASSSVLVRWRSPRLPPWRWIAPPSERLA
jgi:hypothetical protein